jgi:L-rhamnose-H+ transport protein
MSSCFAFGLDAGSPIKALAVAHGTRVMWQGLPVLVVELAGGFTTNFVWCAILSLRNKSYGEYIGSQKARGLTSSPRPVIENPTDAPSTEMALDLPSPAPEKLSLSRNYLYSAFAGAIWYMQFFFYTMGETQMGRYKFSSWTLHMASIILFSTLWGIALKEWSGVSLRTKTFVFLTLIALIGSTVIVGYGNYLAMQH